MFKYDPYTVPTTKAARAIPFLRVVVGALNTFGRRLSIRTTSGHTDELHANQARQVKAGGKVDNTVAERFKI